MLLQIWILPVTQPAGAEQIPSATQAVMAPAGSRTFLESCPANITLEQLCTRICARHDKIYPDKGPLNIKKLQDFYNLDLDLDYVISDVFKDRDSGTPLSSIVKVTQTPSTRESSVPLESALRPHRFGVYGRKRQRAGSISEADHASNVFIKREPGITDVNRYRERRSVKRRRLQEISRSASPNSSDPDRPLPSRELEEDEGATGSKFSPSQREQRDSPGHITEYSRHGHADSSRTRYGTSNRARDVTPNRRLQKQRGPLLSPSIIPDSPVLGVSRHHYVSPWPANNIQREVDAYARPESPPSLDEMQMPGPSTVSRATRDLKGNTKASDLMERFKSLPPPMLSRTAKPDLQRQSSRHSSAGPRPSIAPNASGGLLGNSVPAEPAQKPASERNASTKQEHQFVKPRVVSKHVDPIKSDNSSVVDIRSNNGSTMKEPSQDMDIYEFDSSDETNLLQLRREKRKHDESYGKQPQAQKRPAQENHITGRPQLARRGTLPEAWINAVKGGNTDEGTTDYKPVKDDREELAETSVAVDKKATGRTGVEAGREADISRVGGAAPKEANEGQVKLKVSQASQAEQVETTRKEAPERSSLERPLRAGVDLRESKKGVGTNGVFKQSERKEANARPNGMEERSAMEPETDKREAAIIETQTKPSEEREIQKRRIWEPAPDIGDVDVSDRQNKEKAVKEQEERDVLEAAKLQLKERSDRLSKEWEEKKAAKPTQDQIVAMTNSLATRGAVQNKRISSTPFIPNGVRSKNSKSATNVSLASKEMDKPVGLDALISAPRTVKRTVSFIDEVTAPDEKIGQGRGSDHKVPHDKSKGADGTPISAMKNSADVHGRSTSPSEVDEAPANANAKPVVVREAIRKQTPIYPPGMGPEDLQAAILTTKAATAPTTETDMRDKHQESSQKVPTKKTTQTKLKVIQGVKTKGKAAQTPAPAPITQPKKEIIVLDDDDISISSYYSSGSNKSPVSSKEKKHTSLSSFQKSQPATEERASVPKRADQAPTVSAQAPTENPPSEVVSPLKEAEAQEKSDSKSPSSSSAFQTQIELTAPPTDVDTGKKSGSSSPSVSSAASGSRSPAKDSTARGRLSSKSPSAFRSPSPPKRVTAQGKPGAKSRSASPSASDSASSESSSRSSTRSPARYLSHTPPSDSAREEDGVSRSPSGSLTPAEEESKSPSRRDSRSPEKPSRTGRGQEPAAVEKDDSASSVAGLDDNDPNKSSPSLPENDKDLNAYLQQHARQSSQPTYPVSSQVTNPKSKPTSNDKKKLSFNEGSNTLPRLTTSKTTSTTKRARTSSRVDPFSKTLSRQLLSSQLQRTKRQHQPATPLSSGNRTRPSSKQVKPPESDSEEDEDDESESESQSSSEDNNKKTNRSDSDEEEVKDNPNLTPPSAQPPRRRHPHAHQTPKRHHRQSSPSTKSAARIRASMITTPAASLSSSTRKTGRGTTTSANSKGAGDGRTGTAGKVVAGRLSGLLSTLNPFSSSIG